MLEDCADLVACEETLQNHLNGIVLLGQVGLVEQDYERLSQLIRAETQRGFARGVRLVAQSTPTALAYFLVSAGIFGYKDGDYWSEVWTALDHDRNPARERRLGRFFLRFLKDHDLPTFQILRSHRYVTPILLHGGIPTACLQEYFERIMFPSLRHDDFTTTGIADEVVQELKLLRRDQRELEELETHLSDLKKQTQHARDRAATAKRLLQVREQIVDLWAMESEVEILQDVGNLPNRYAKCQNLCRNVTQTLRDLAAQREKCPATVAAFTTQDGVALQSLPAFREWVGRYPDLMKEMRALDSLTKEGDELNAELRMQTDGILVSDWEDESERLLQVDLDQLRQAITEWKVAAIRVEDLEAQQARYQLPVDQGRFAGICSQVMLASGGVMLTAIGALMSLSPVLIVAGIASIGAAGYLHVRRMRGASQPRREQAKIIDALVRARAEESTRKAKVDCLIQDLPIESELKSHPSDDCVRAIATVVGCHQTLMELRSSCDKMKVQIRQSTQVLRDIAECLSIEPTGDIEALARVVAVTMQQAKTQRVAAEEAKAKLESSEVEVRRLQDELSRAQQETLAIEGRLAALGDGNVKVGMRKVTELQLLEKDAAQQRRQLEATYPDLAQMEETLRDGADGLTDEARRLEERLRELKDETAQVGAALDHVSVPYQGVDEPVRKYLLYGGEVSERFLLQTATLLRCARRDQSATEKEIDALPTYVLAAFESWWTMHRHREELAVHLGIAEEIGGQRFRTPAIVLDSGLAEVTVHIDPQLVSASSAGRLELKVRGDGPEHDQAIALTTYRDSRDLLRTEKTSCPLAFPAERYVFTLQAKRNTVRQWDLAAIRPEAACYLFDARSGRVLPKGAVPRAMIWMLSRVLRPADETQVFETGQLYGQWRDYRYWAIDLENADTLRVVDLEGTETEIPVAAESVAELGLVEGYSIWGVTVGGVPVYAGTPPRVRIPIKDETDLDRWRFSAYAEEADQPRLLTYSRLSDLTQAIVPHVDEGYVDINLTDSTLLGEHPTGTYRLRARKDPYIDWSEIVCLIQTLALTFDRTLYVPCEVGQTSAVTAAVTVGESAQLICQPPTKVHRIGPGQFNLAGTTAQAALRYLLNIPEVSEGGKSAIPISARIPKLQWRLQGLSDPEQIGWHDMLEELWLGDWERTSELFLIADWGGTTEGNVQLQVAERPSVSQRRSVRAGRARFDLLPFRDELRTMGGLKTLVVSAPDLGITDVPIFRIRTRWEASDIECVQRTERDTVALQVSWSEVGKTEGRKKVLRLWQVVDATTVLIMIIQQRVSGTSHKFQFPRGKLRAGRYILELALEDPWSSTSAKPPTAEAPNTRLITIAAGQDPLQDQTLRVRYVGEPYSQRRYPLKGIYTFHIIGRIVHHALPPSISDDGILVTDTNEGWYVAEVDVLNDPELREEVQRANPVKIDYDAHRRQLTCAEDRSGDGAMYCRQCRRLHWRQETIKAEERRRHKLLGPIERFYIS